MRKGPVDLLTHIAGRGLEVRTRRVRQAARPVPRPRVRPPRRERFAGIPAPPVKVNLQTTAERLVEMQNDYSYKEKLFQGGMVDFVDLIGPRNLCKLPTNDLYRKDRNSVFRNFLESRDGVETLTIVIPTVRGRQTALLECLESIRRQTFLQHHPDKIELIVIQDQGSAKHKKDPGLQAIYRSLKTLPSHLKQRLFTLRGKQGRSTARNVGVFYGSHTYAFFIDSNIVLGRDFIAEHMIRHQRVPHVALVGFKENIKPREYIRTRSRIRNGSRQAEYKKDLKWSHKLTLEEARFPIGGRSYSVGKTINYMKFTDF